MENQKEKSTYFDKFLDSAIGKSVVVVERNGCMSFGTLAEYSGYRLSLARVKIQGKHTVNVPWVIIERSVVAHVHPNASGEDNSTDEQERQRIATFLRNVHDSATHGSSDLMDRAIVAIESNDLSDPARIAEPHVPST